MNGEDFIRCSSIGPRQVQCVRREGHDALHAAYAFVWESNNDHVRTASAISQSHDVSSSHDHGSSGRFQDSQGT